LSPFIAAIADADTLLIVYAIRYADDFRYTLMLSAITC